MVELLTLAIWLVFSLLMWVQLQSLPSGNLWNAVVFAGVIALIFYLPVKFLIWAVARR